MANQNLFEKYGIKEVADVTFYRIEKKEETYEAIREISAGSVLKGALELRTVYPVDENGMGEDEGFTAYVFVDADIVDGETYGHSEGHEYSYAEQVCMLFARRQNLISKTGVRYQFNAEDLLAGIEFSSDFVSAPNSTDKVVVVGLPESMTISTYNAEDVNAKIKDMTQTISAKAYDVTYSDYAELIVEDEMGYFNPAFIGTSYDKVAGTVKFVSETNKYTDLDKYDAAIASADMWNKDNCKSINDAIEALRAKKAIVDVSTASGNKGVKSISGGYTVTDSVPTPGKEDSKENYADNEYVYQLDGNVATDVAKSEYPLAEVLKAVSQISLSADASGKALEVGTSGKSNRAIYVNVGNSVDTAAGSFIYLLHNKNYRKLALDKEGIFQFEDKVGNTLYYQDKVFVGVEWLALVVVGTQGMIFVVNRHGKSAVSRVGWMVNESGYLTDSKAEIIVNNGLIHTTDITVNSETFEATCTVKSLKIHKTVKNTKRYVPVLFLDTLKISTLEQTGEEVFATGGRGNSQLIGWDFGKEITLSLQDALFTPASMSAMFGSYEGDDFRKGVKETKSIDRFNKYVAKRSFIVPAGNKNGTPTEADKTAQAVYYDPHTMEPFEDGTPIAEGEVYYKFTRSVAYEGQSLGHTIEISADSFPGTYKVVGETYVRAQEGGADQRFMISIAQAKMSTEQTIELSADGDPSVFDMSLKVLRPEDGIMVKFIQFDVVENEEENDGSTMVKNTENLNLLDDAELFKVAAETASEDNVIGATEY